MKKIEAVEYAIDNKRNHKAQEKYGVSEGIIKYCRSEINKLRKESKTKIIFYKGPSISDELFKIDLQLLEFYEINR